VKKVLLVLMAFALLVASGFIAVKDASADALLYPAVRTDGNFITFVNVVNKSTATSLHWMYRYDDPAVAGNQCYHKDGFAKTTPNDMFTVDISNTIDAGKPLPAGVDTTSGSYNLGKGWPGLLTIYAFTGAYPGTPTGENTLFGEAAIINIATSEIYKYKALNDFYGTDEGNLDDMGYGAYPFDPTVIPGQTVMPTAVWYPVAAVSTQWYVMVGHNDLAWAVPGPPATCTTLSARVAFADVAGDPMFFYDINENLLSATSGITVDCFAYLTLANFIAPASLPDAANGGWANVQMTVPTPSSDPLVACDKSIHVYKLESTTALTGKMQSHWTSQMRVDW
jgi:hypothetical protein